MSTPQHARATPSAARGAPDPQIVVRLSHLQHTAGNAAVVRMLAGPPATDRPTGSGPYENAPDLSDDA
ncbi:hypothetical protein GCM10010329_85560 [Streptomyces spiroverticillatus]|nr:hypothetical protein GCM10010329_85560 [Streptomyces spiroverticillatus]